MNHHLQEQHWYFWHYLCVNTCTEYPGENFGPHPTTTHNNYHLSQIFFYLLESILLLQG